jgi:hypothetical protein
LQVVLHAALSGSMLSRCEGVEYVPSRAAKAAGILSDLLACDASSASASASASGDASALSSSAAAVAARVRAPPGLLSRRLARTALRQGDATVAGTLSRFSHVYMYDKVFSDATSASLAAQLNAPLKAPPPPRRRNLARGFDSDSEAAAGSCADAGMVSMQGVGPRVLVSYRRPESWRKLGLGRGWAHVSHVTMRTTGGQNFRAYIFARA